MRNLAKKDSDELQEWVVDLTTDTGFCVDIEKYRRGRTDFAKGCQYITILVYSF